MGTVGTSEYMLMISDESKQIPLDKKHFILKFADSVQFRHNLVRLGRLSSV